MTRNERIAHFRAYLHPKFLPLYNALWEAAPKEFAPYFGFRSWDEQAKLFARGRDENGKIIDPGEIVTHAKAGSSAHNYGCAVDATICHEDGHVEWITPQDARWENFVRAVEKVGLISGKHFHDIDHAELPIKCSWNEVAKMFQEDGEAIAMRFIADNYIG